MVYMILVGDPGFEALEENFNYDNSVYVKREFQRKAFDILQQIVELSEAFSMFEDIIHI